MPFKRPQLPKVLAARIRAAQRKVADKRIAIIAGDRRIAQVSERVNLYQVSPYGYADQYYQGCDIHSYPVHTRIARDREELAYYQRRAPGRIVELAEAEANLSVVEDEVLLKVFAMRPSTGRVPWPGRLRPFEDVGFELQLRWAREDEKLKAAHARQMAIMNAQAAKADEAFQASITALVDVMKARIDRMTKGKRAEARTAIADRLDRLQHGEIGAFEFLAEFVE
ncbi:hypothetical protein [Sphingomonas bacterium]|uniref:hypothetical protein n=1 Tax=Sphingomonas bacterium TaxID=1895847 RepID=UPI00157671E1|nr:hypothetical protein [Sphingomonas bacterium]